jgi:predicted CxxxxCH...CXXCH cytochrome family protein
VIALLGLVACLEVRDDRLVADGGVASGGSGVDCDPCHSPSGDSPAHVVHLGGGEFARPDMACDDCHPVPSSSITDQHPDDTVQVIFPAGTLATYDGSSPSWDGARCSGVYCHGASLSGGSYTDPAWRGEIDEGVACGMCHGVPPPESHVQIAACENCHNVTFDGSGSLSVDTHANGTVDFNDGRGNLGGVR